MVSLESRYDASYYCVIYKFAYVVQFSKQLNVSSYLVSLDKLLVEFVLLRSRKVISGGALKLPLNGFLSVFYGNIWPTSAHTKTYKPLKWD